MKKILLFLISFLSITCISFASVEHFDNLIDKTTKNQSERQVMKMIMRMESMGNANAKNPGSSAAGGFQIINDTWESSVEAAYKQGLITRDEWREALKTQPIRGKYGNKYPAKNNPALATKIALAHLRTKPGSMTDKILAYHDGSAKSNFDEANLEGRKYVIKANEMYKALNGKDMPGFERVKNSKTYQKWLKDGTVDKLRKDAKARIKGMSAGEVTDEELSENEVVGKAVTVNLKPTQEVNLDKLANDILNYFMKNAGKIKGVTITILSFLFCLQIIFDCITGIASNNLKAIATGIIFKRGLTFTFYLMIINKIFDGSLIEMIKKMAIGIVKAFLGVEINNPLQQAWNLKEYISTAIWKGIYNTWTAKWHIITHPLQSYVRFQGAIILTILLIVFWLFILFTFFRIIFDLLKMIISLNIGLILGSILLGLGMVDATKQYYSIGKIISICLNYILKFASINILFSISIKILNESSYIMGNEEIRLENAFGDFMLYFLLVYIVYNLISKTQIEF